MTFDPLDAFMDWFLKSPSIGFVPFTAPSAMIDGVTALTWLRQGQFQVQLFVVPPHHVIPEHTHPNVDSYEIYLGGQIRFSHSGRYVVPEDALAEPTPDGLAAMRGQIIRVRPDALHGGVFGPEGGVFMSVQHWLNGVKPHCVSADYNGAVMGPEHLARVVHGEAHLPETIAPALAASMEDSDG